MVALGSCTRWATSCLGLEVISPSKLSSCFKLAIAHLPLEHNSPRAETDKCSTYPRTPGSRIPHRRFSSASIATNLCILRSANHRLTSNTVDTDINAFSATSSIWSTIGYNVARLNSLQKKDGGGAVTSTPCLTLSAARPSVRFHYLRGIIQKWTDLNLWTQLQASLKRKSMPVICWNQCVHA